MKTCVGCKYADWQKNKNGRLHRSGDGQCRKIYVLPPLPASMYWLGTPTSSGGHINRKEELKEHCVYYLRELQSENPIPHRSSVTEETC